jgi:hypothetical protein
MTFQRRRRGLAALVIVATASAWFAVVAPPGRAVQIAQDRVVSDVPAPWTPQILDGRVEVIRQIGNRILAGGTFTQAQNSGGGATFTRNRLIAFNATTGAIDTGFAPNVNGTVTSMVQVPGSTDLIIGGNFTSVNGVARQRLARINSTTGAVVTSFTATASAIVQDMTLVGSNIVVGGNFQQVSGVARSRLAMISATTGALQPSLNLSIAGLHTGGVTHVNELDVSPDGTRLLIVGNFTTVAGQPREQIAMIDLTTNPASLTDWQTNDFIGQCHPNYATYMRDVEYSPDGTYFVIVTTGAGFYPTTLCDTASRWEANATGPDQHPTWADYTGGDSLTAVAVTGTAIYVGGHPRWMNNGIVGDFAVGGAVVREGIAALDPQNGMPLRWNPGRARGQGVFGFLATPAGLWIGHDTNSVGGATHRRIAFFPLAGGSVVPIGQDATLPGTVFAAPPQACSNEPNPYLYRVNAGGPPVAASDCGPDWAGDQDFSSPYRNDGSNTADWGSNGSMGPSLPVTTPGAIFATERWDPGDPPEMHWSFPVPAGTALQIRLYFTNQYGGTSQVGQRVFDVTLDGTEVLSDYDIVADVGDQTAVMKSWNVTSDGAVDIEFGHVVENPLVNGIEVVDRNLLPGPQPIPAPFLRRSAYDGTAFGPTTTLNTPGTDWSQARGTFFLNGTLYAGWSNGRLYGWTFDGSALGDQEDVLEQGDYVLGPDWISFADVSGMFWLDGRLYLTRVGDPNLSYRFFTPESELVGTNTAVVSGPGIDGLDWSDVRGMTYASGRIYVVDGVGNLRRIAVNGGVPDPATLTTVSGPAIDGRDWRSNGLFVTSQAPPTDTTPPTTPGQPVGTATGPSTIDVTWDASSDAVSSQLTYRIYRDGGGSPVGTVTSASTTTVSFTDTGLGAGTTHTYTVTAADGAGNTSPASPPSAPITTTSAIFADDFGSGTLVAWDTATRMTVDTTTGGAAPPSARASVTGQSAFLRENLVTTLTTGCVSEAVNLSSLGANAVDLVRFRTAVGGPVVRVFASASRVLVLRSDVTGAQRSSGVALPAGWNTIELCGTVGTSGSWSLYLNGGQIVNGWTADTGTTPIGRIDVGDTASKTFAMNVDDVVVDQTVG